MPENSLQQAYRYCEWLTRHHYENFPVASWLLPASKRPHVAALYAFARSADDFADESKYRGRGLALLNAWKTALWASSASRPSEACSTDGVPTDHPIFLALADTIHRCKIPVELLSDLLTAFTLDVTKKRYTDWEDLLNYCRYSANPVGRLVLLIFDVADPKLHRLSDFICTGLQLANHWQDLSIDFLEKDRLYIPADLMAQFRVTEANLKEKTGQPIAPPFRALVKELVRRTRALFDQGEPLIHQVSGRLRWELKWTLLGGRTICDRIEGADFDLFRHRPVLSSFTKLKLLAYAAVP